MYQYRKTCLMWWTTENRRKNPLTFFASLNWKKRLLGSEKRHSTDLNFFPVKMAQIMHKHKHYIWCIWCSDVYQHFEGNADFIERVTVWFCAAETFEARVIRKNKLSEVFKEETLSSYQSGKESMQSIILLSSTFYHPNQGWTGI